MKNVYIKLGEIQAILKVAKDRKNDFGGFAYRNQEDILEAVKPLLKEKGLVLLLSDTVVGVNNKNYVEATAILTDGEETITVKAMAREADEPKAKMDDSQLTGSTSSYARKYALNGLFLIDDAVDADSAKPVANTNLDKAKKDFPAKDYKPTQKQLTTLKNFGWTGDVSKLTGKEASKLIGEYFDKKNKTKAPDEEISNEDMNMVFESIENE